MNSNKLYYLLAIFGCLLLWSALSAADQRQSSGEDSDGKRSRDLGSHEQPAERGGKGSHEGDDSEVRARILGAARLRINEGKEKSESSEEENSKGIVSPKDETSRRKSKKPRKGIPIGKDIAVRNLKLDGTNNKAVNVQLFWPKRGSLITTNAKGERTIVIPPIPSFHFSGLEINGFNTTGLNIELYLPEVDESDPTKASKKPPPPENDRPKRPSGKENSSESGSHEADTSKESSTTKYDSDESSTKYPSRPKKKRPSGKENSSESGSHEADSSKESSTTKYDSDESSTKYPSRPKKDKSKLPSGKENSSESGSHEADTSNESSTIKYDSDESPKKYPSKPKKDKSKRPSGKENSSESGSYEKETSKESSTIKYDSDESSSKKDKSKRPSGKENSSESGSYEKDTTTTKYDSEEHTPKYPSTKTTKPSKTRPKKIKSKRPSAKEDTSDSESDSYETDTSIKYPIETTSATEKTTDSNSSSSSEEKQSQNPKISGPKPKPSPREGKRSKHKLSFHRNGVPTNIHISLRQNQNIPHFPMYSDLPRGYSRHSSRSRSGHSSRSRTGSKSHHSSSSRWSNRPSIDYSPYSSYQSEEWSSSHPISPSDESPRWSNRGPSRSRGNQHSSHQGSDSDRYETSPSWSNSHEDDTPSHNSERIYYNSPVNDYYGLEGPLLGILLPEPLDKGDGRDVKGDLIYLA